MNKAIIFDLDGTLIDSLPDIFDNITIMLEKFGYEKRTYKEVMSYIGNGARMLVKSSLPEGETEERIDECLGYYNGIYTSGGSPKTKLFDGIKETLVELKKRGYKLAILTNKPQITTDNVYKTYMSDLGFDEVVGQRPGAKIKPDPTEALKILSKLSVKVESAYFIGDGETDAELAKRGNLQGISVLWGYRDKATLAQYGAVNFAEKPSDLLEFIK